MGDKIFIVEVIDGEELLSYSEAFKDSSEAEKFFIHELVRLFEVEGDSFSPEEVKEILEDGRYCDEGHTAIIIKEIPFNN